jgi:hypothetical protein
MYLTKRWVSVAEGAGCEFGGVGLLEGLFLAATAKLCCPRHFDSSEWFVFARGRKVFLERDRERVRGGDARRGMEEWRR